MVSVLRTTVAVVVSLRLIMVCSIRWFPVSSDRYNEVSVDVRGVSPTFVSLKTRTCLQFDSSGDDVIE